MIFSMEIALFYFSVVSGCVLFSGKIRFAKYERYNAQNLSLVCTKCTLDERQVV